MNKKAVLTLFFGFVLILSIVNVQAFWFFSESYKDDGYYKEKWKYEEDLHGKHQGFILTHTVKGLPVYESQTYAASDDKVTSGNTAFPSFRTGAFSSPGYYGSVNYRNNYILNSAFRTYRYR